MDNIQRVDLRAGDVLRSESGGQYRILRQLGEGGFGVVYRVEDERGDAYACKLTRLWEFMPHERAEVRKRFAQEYHFGRRLQSDYVVSSHDAGLIHENPYLVMDLCPNGNLNDKLNEPIPLPAAMNYGRQVLKGLHTLHREGIIHRDLKPENVLFNPHNQACLADFGISASIKQQNRATRKVGWQGKAEAVFATPQYAPPEQSDPRRAFHTMGPTNDIFAFGVLFYEMLTRGKLPFGDCAAPEQVTSYEQRKKAGEWDRRTLMTASSDSALEAILTRCLHPDHGQRFQQVAEILRLLGEDVAEPRAARPSQWVGQWQLRVMNGDELDRTYFLSRLSQNLQRGLLTLGWLDPEEPFANDLGLAEEFTQYISARHATLERQEVAPGRERWFIRDGQWYERDGRTAWHLSTNGVLVNSAKADANGHPLAPGDIITIGNTTLKVELMA